jgi:hypothetical protein
MRRKLTFLRSRYASHAVDGRVRGAIASGAGTIHSDHIAGWVQANRALNRLSAQPAGACAAGRSAGMIKGSIGS